MTYSSDNQGFLRQTYKNSVVSLENSYCFGRVINVQRRGHTEGSNKNSNSLNLKQNYSFDYDYFGNIERAEQSDSVRGTIAKSTYRYDRFNQLIQEERDGKTWFYQYDTVGNLLWVKTFDKSYDDYEEAASAVSYKPELLLGTDTYTYGDSEWQDLLTAFNGRSITYDAIGNPLTYYNGTDYTMTWEQGRRLTSLRAGGKTVGYRYDSAGKRTGKTVGTGQTEYIYAGGQLVSILGTNPDYRIDLIYDESGVQSCIYTAGTAAPVTYYLIKNAQGDVMQLRDEADTIVANYAYDAFGRLLSVTDIDGKAISDQTSFAHRNPLRYRGYLYDSETGFYYLGSRYYDPKIRRFINADSQLNLREGVVGYNLFAYCNNNPVIHSDPSGTIPFLVITAAIGAVAGAVVGGIVAAKNGGNTWAGVAIGAAAGALIGTGAGAAAGLALAGSITASTGAVLAGSGALASAVSAGGLGAGISYISNNISRGIGASSAAQAAAEKMRQVSEKGRAGEVASGLVKNTQRIYITSTKYRIQDGLDITNKILSEVKNYSGTLSFTSQLRDFVSWSQTNGYQVHLYTNAHLTSPLQWAVDSGLIQVFPLK